MQEKEHYSLNATGGSADATLVSHTTNSTIEESSNTLKTCQQVLLGYEPHGAAQKWYIHPSAGNYNEGSQGNNGYRFLSMPLTWNRF